MYTHGHQIQSFKPKPPMNGKTFYSSGYKGSNKTRKKRKTHREAVPKIRPKRAVTSEHNPQMARKIGGRRYKKVKPKKTSQEQLLQTYKTQMLFAALCVVLSTGISAHQAVDSKKVAELTFLMGPQHASVEVADHTGCRVIGKYPDDASRWVCDGIIVDETEDRDYHREIKVRKSVPLTPDQFRRVISTINANAADPIYLAIGDNCVDFAQEVYKATGQKGHFAKDMGFKDITGKAQAYAWMRSHRGRSYVIDALGIATLLFSLLQASRDQE